MKTRKGPVPVRITGDGSHPVTKIFDGETGEDLAKRYNIQSFALEAGGTHFPGPVLVLRLYGPLVIDLLSDTADDQDSAARRPE